MQELLSKKMDSSGFAKMSTTVKYDVWKDPVIVKMVQAELTRLQHTPAASSTSVNRVGMIYPKTPKTYVQQR